MGWSNPDVPWSELEAALSGRTGSSLSGGPEADGGDSPAWSRKREPYRPADPPAPAPGPRVPYAELHCHSNFSFLDGASHPEELVEQAARLGLDALALTDHDGMYGVVRFAEAAAELGVRTVFGAELSLGLTAPQNGVADPEGSHLLLLARDPDGYRGLCRTISTAQLAGQGEGAPGLRPRGGRRRHGRARARAHRLPQGRGAAGAGAAVGAPRRLPRSVAWSSGSGRTTSPSSSPTRRCPRTPRSTTPWPASPPTRGCRPSPPPPRTTPRRSGSRWPRRWRRSGPGAAWTRPTAGCRPRAPRTCGRARRWPPGSTPAIPARWRGRRELGAECAFAIDLVAPDLPPFETPPGITEAKWLRELTRRGVLQRYGSYAEYPEAVATVERELEVIEARKFPGYFLIVHDIVAFCRASGILCQGRGSAANSAVCYALGITNVDAVSHGLLFERFLSPARDGYPDIDLDIESGRREEVIQYVYSRYGRDRAAQVANVISYRPRSAVRDVAKALGFSPGQQDAWSKQIERWHGTEGGDVAGMPEQVGELANQLLGFPRHLGIHSGGMVICDRPVAEVVPVEWARMDGRTVVQWDKDDCAAAGLVKFDLLGLGMLTALHLMIDLVAEHHGRRVALHELQPVDPEVYAMLARADSVGVFQVESRAQMATLPAAASAQVLRPGRRGRADPARPDPGRLGAPLHPAAQQVRRSGTTTTRCWRTRWRKTLGVPLFQEQLMQVAVDVAGFSPAEADELRRAMGAKRSTERMERLRGRFYEGMAANGIEGALADKIFDRMLAFANFGFPESHSISFASLVYYSAWFKLYHPSAFCAALLNAQPMGFYSPQSLVADARRHGVRVRGPDVNLGGARAVLQPDAHSAGGQAVRLGMADIRNDRREARRADRGGARRATVPTGTWPTWPVASGSPSPQAEALATAGALGSFGVDRRAALWAAGVVAAVRPDQLPGTAVGLDAPALPGMTAAELTVADVWATGVSPDSHPIVHLRERLDRFGAIPIDRLGRRGPWHAGPDAPPRVLVGGLVTHRQRPRRRAGSRSSTWKTRPACSTSPARRGCGGATGRWRWAAPRCWCGAGWNAARRGC